jgi:hypothetical protein
LVGGGTLVGLLWFRHVLVRHALGRFLQDFLLDGLIHGSSLLEHGLRRLHRLGIFWRHLYIREVCA